MEGGLKCDVGRLGSGGTSALPAHAARPLCWLCFFDQVMDIRTGRHVALAVSVPALPPEWQPPCAWARSEAT